MKNVIDRAGLFSGSNTERRALVFNFRCTETAVAGGVLLPGDTQRVHVAGVHLGHMPLAGVHALGVHALGVHAAGVCTAGAHVCAAAAGHMPQLGLG